jgi:hypothetical protein
VISPVFATLVPNTAAPLELGARNLRIDNQAGIHRHIDSWNSDLALIVHFDFDNRGARRQPA